MSEAPAAAASEPGANSRASAGAMLRAARQAQGLHIAALAASVNVPQGKLEALENDRIDELPDITFARALAKTVCRTLKIDPVPVLAIMPSLGEQGLDKVHQGLNTTFRDRPGRMTPGDMNLLRRPAIWLPLLIVLAAGFVFLMPQQWIVQTRPAPEAASAPFDAVQPASSSASTFAEPASEAALATAATNVEPAAAPAIEAASAPALSGDTGAAVPVAASLLEFKVTGESWIEVLDVNGATLLQRKLEAGEFVGLDGTPPFRLKVGNAAATQLSFRGQVVDLKPVTRDNVARLELK